MIVQPPSRSRRLSVCTVTIGACRIFRQNVTWRRGLRRSGSSSKLVPKWVLEVLDEVELSGGRVFEVTAGDIILLWRVGFDTFTTQSWFPKYFEYTLRD